MAYPPRAAAAALLLVLVGVAGCFDSQPNVVPQDGEELLYWLTDELPVDIDHDHAQGALHAASLNLHPMGYSSCTSDGAMDSAVGGFTDIAFHDDHAFVGNAHGFCILDISNASQPRFVAQYQGEPSADLEVSGDGKFVFLLTQRNGVPNPPQRGILDPTASFPRGVIIVDVTDRTQPTFESYYPVPTNGVHTATAYLMGTRQLLFVQTYDWFPPGGVPTPIPQQNLPLTQRVEILELITLNGVKVLERIAGWSLDRPATEPLAFWFPHDAFAQFHPRDRKTYLYVAYWDAGLVILDVTTPESPTFVSRYDDPTPSIYNAYHDVKAFDHLIGERHITVTGPEIVAGPEAGHVRIFDTTDPTNPVQLGTWRLPGNPGTPADAPFLFSPHVFTLHDGKIYLGHNHGGVWVLDVGTPERLRDPGAAAFYFPPTKDDARSGVWGAYYHEGYVYATESSSGVHVLHYAGDLPPEDAMMAPPHHQ